MSCVTSRTMRSPAHKLMNQTTLLTAVAFIVPGAVLLWFTTKSYAPEDIWQPSLYGQVGGLLVATGLITLTWELVGKRAFTAELMSKTQLREDIVRSGVQRVTDQYLQDVEWDELFASSRRLDIVVAYASTWRNANRRRLEELVSKSGGGLRVFLPDPDDPETMSVLAKRFDMTPIALEAKIEEAIEDFKGLGAKGNVEVYVRSGDALFSCYQFDHRSVMTLYSHSQERRGSVPTFLVGDGMLREFVGTDIEAIEKQSRRI